MLSQNHIKNQSLGPTRCYNKFSMTVEDKQARAYTISYQEPKDTVPLVKGIEIIIEFYVIT